MSNKNNKKAIIAVAILLVLVVGAIILWFATRPEAPEAGRATIVVSVTHKDGSVKDFTISTEGHTLREALEQENLIAGDEGEWGLYVKTVDGETADDTNQEWWHFTKDGVDTSSVDNTEIADGDHYEIGFTIGW